MTETRKILEIRGKGFPLAMPSRRQMIKKCHVHASVNPAIRRISPRIEMVRRPAESLVRQMSAALSIDPTTGALRLAEHVSLAPFSLADAVKAELQAFDASMRNMKTGWVWFDVPRVVLGGLLCDLSLALEAGTFREWSVTVAHGDSAWPTEKESADEEKKLARANASVLKIGAPLRSHGFSWGEAWCCFDPKGGFSSAGARFKEPNQALEPTAPNGRGSS